MTLKFEYAERNCTLNGVYSRVARFPFCQLNPPNCFSKLAKMFFFWWRPPGNICIPGDRYHVIWVVSTCGHEKQPVETVGKPWTWQLWSTGFMDCFYDTSVVRSFWCLFVQDGLFLCSAEQRNELGLDRVVILNPRLWWTLTSLDDLIPYVFPSPSFPQLIIITGPSYEALTSEGIQLNVGGGDVEEVTCTLIGDVSYNQMCPSGASSRPSPAGTVRSHCWPVQCFSS